MPTLRPAFPALLPDVKSKSKSTVRLIRLQQGEIHRLNLQSHHRADDARLSLDCEFCAASKLYGPRYRVKPVARVKMDADAGAVKQPFIRSPTTTCCEQSLVKNCCMDWPTTTSVISPGYYYFRWAGGDLTVCAFVSERLSAGIDQV